MNRNIKRSMAGAVVLASALGVAQVDNIKYKTGMMLKSKRYVVYNPKDMKKLLVVKDKPVLIQDDSMRVVEDRVYSLDFACAPDLDPPVIDPTPTDAVVPWGINKVQAIEAQVLNNGKDIIVCVADTGVDVDHPDIKDMIIGGESYVAGEGSYDDDEGHGTHVAGIIAAQANDRDVIGVAQSRILVSKVLDSWGSGYGSWIAAGIVGCVNKGARIINMSLGSGAEYGPDPLIRDAVNYAISKNVIVVAAAGNDSGDPVGYPAALPGVIGVASSDRNDRLSSFSNVGPEIDYIAPGSDILSLKNGGGVVSYSGTSMATPHVAGVIALSLATGNPVGVDNIGLAPEQQGAGRVNALKTVKGER